MKILVTAGSTMTMIDQVRGISNIFKGNTGMAIASYCENKGHDVTLITSNSSHAETVSNVITYRTYDELYSRMLEQICGARYDAIIHSAAVSDYKPDRVYVSNREPGKHGGLTAIDATTKVGSDHDELFLRLVPTEKIIDKIRDPWGFKGILIKFKLQVGMTDEELIRIATKSMKHSKADAIVANCLEWCRERAYLIAPHSCLNIVRKRIPEALESFLI